VAFLIDTTLILPVSARGLLLDTWIIATAVKADGTKTNPNQLSAGAEDLQRFAVARLGDGKLQFDVYNKLGAKIVDHDAIVPRQKVYVVLRNQVLPLGVFQGAPLYLHPIFLFCQARHKCPSYMDGPAWPCLQLSLSVAAQART
jgi:hypothetical protein